MKEVGKIIRIEIDNETDEVYIVMEIIDKDFKKKVIHNNDLKDLITLKGKKVMSVATKEK